MKHYFIPIILSCFILTGCQKEVTFDTGGTSTSCDTYFPLTTGSTWTYDANGAAQVNTVVTPDTVIQGKNFKRITELISGITNTVFFREESGNVYGFIDLGGLASGKILINPIRSSAAVGDKWRDTIIINGIKEKFEYEMLEKNINYQVDTFHFTNVLHIQYKVRLDYPPLLNDELIQITDVWVAKCVGGVETKNQVFLMGVVVNTTDQKIKSYTIR